MLYRKHSHAEVLTLMFSGLLASVVHTVMAQFYKGYMNIVDVFGTTMPCIHLVIASNNLQRFTTCHSQLVGY